MTLVYVRAQGRRALGSETSTQSAPVAKAKDCIEAGFQGVFAGVGMQEPITEFPSIVGRLAFPCGRAERQKGRP